MSRICTWKDGTPRYCVEYWKVSSFPVRDYYRFPRIDAYIVSLGDAELVLTLDAHNGYWKTEAD